MITLENITLGYGRRILLERVSARFEAGQLTALIGRNGTGKSTLLRAMAGLERPLGGEISICGEPIGNMPSDRLARRTAFVTTDKVRVANMRCEDLVALLAGGAGVDLFGGALGLGHALSLASVPSR